MMRNFLTKRFSKRKVRLDDQDSSTSQDHHEKGAVPSPTTVPTATATASHPPSVPNKKQSPAQEVVRKESAPLKKINTKSVAKRPANKNAGPKLTKPRGATPSTTSSVPSGSTKPRTILKNKHVKSPIKRHLLNEMDVSSSSDDSDDSGSEEESSSSSDSYTSDSNSSSSSSSSDSDTTTSSSSEEEEGTKSSSLERNTKALQSKRQNPGPIPVKPFRSPRSLATKPALAKVSAPSAPNLSSAVRPPIPIKAFHINSTPLRIEDSETSSSSVGPPILESDFEKERSVPILRPLQPDQQQSSNLSPRRKSLDFAPLIQETVKLERSRTPEAVNLDEEKARRRKEMLASFDDLRRGYIPTFNKESSKAKAPKQTPRRLNVSKATAPADEINEEETTQFGFRESISLPEPLANDILQTAVPSDPQIDNEALCESRTSEKIPKLVPAFEAMSQTPENKDYEFVEPASGDRKKVNASLEIGAQDTAVEVDKGKQTNQVLPGIESIPLEDEEQQVALRIQNTLQEIQTIQRLLVEKQELLARKKAEVERLHIRKKNLENLRLESNKISLNRAEANDSISCNTESHPTANGSSEIVQSEPVENCCTESVFTDAAHSRQSCLGQNQSIIDNVAEELVDQVTKIGNECDGLAMNSLHDDARHETETSTEDIGGDEIPIKLSSGDQSVSQTVQLESFPPSRFPEEETGTMCGRWGTQEDSPGDKTSNKEDEIVSPLDENLVDSGDTSTQGSKEVEQHFSNSLVITPDTAEGNLSLSGTAEGVKVPRDDQYEEIFPLQTDDQKTNENNKFFPDEALSGMEIEQDDTAEMASMDSETCFTSNQETNQPTTGSENAALTPETMCTKPKEDEECVSVDDFHSCEEFMVNDDGKIVGCGSTVEISDCVEKVGSPGLSRESGEASTWQTGNRQDLKDDEVDNDIRASGNPDETPRNPGSELPHNNLLNDMPSMQKPKGNKSTEFASDPIPEQNLEENGPGCCENEFPSAMCFALEGDDSYGLRSEGDDHIPCVAYRTASISIHESAVNAGEISRDSGDENSDCSSQFPASEDSYREIGFSFDESIVAAENEVESSFLLPGEGSNSTDEGSMVNLEYAQYQQKSASGHHSETSSEQLLSNGMRSDQQCSDHKTSESDQLHADGANMHMKLCSIEDEVEVLNCELSARSTHSESSIQERESSFSVDVSHRSDTDDAQIYAEMHSESETSLFRDSSEAEISFRGIKPENKDRIDTVPSEVSQAFPVLNRPNSTFGKGEAMKCKSDKLLGAAVVSEETDKNEEHGDFGKSKINEEDKESSLLQVCILGSNDAPSTSEKYAENGSDCIQREPLPGGRLEKVCPCYIQAEEDPQTFVAENDLSESGENDVRGVENSGCATDENHELGEQGYLEIVPDGNVIFDPDKEENDSPREQALKIISAASVENEYDQFAAGQSGEPLDDFARETEIFLESNNEKASVRSDSNDSDEDFHGALSNNLREVAVRSSSDDCRGMPEQESNNHIDADSFTGVWDENSLDREVCTRRKQPIDENRGDSQRGNSEHEQSESVCAEDDSEHIEVEDFSSHIEQSVQDTPTDQETSERENMNESGTESYSESGSYENSDSEDSESVCDTDDDDESDCDSAFSLTIHEDKDVSSLGCFDPNDLVELPPSSLCVSTEEHESAASEALLELHQSKTIDLIENDDNVADEEPRSYESERDDFMEELSTKDAKSIVEDDNAGAEEQEVIYHETICEELETIADQIAPGGGTENQDEKKDRTSVLEESEHHATPGKSISSFEVEDVYVNRGETENLCLAENIDFQENMSETEHIAATRIQTLFRAWVAAELYELRRYAVVLIQAQERGRQVRKHFVFRKESTSTVCLDGCLIGDVKHEGRREYDPLDPTNREREQESFSRGRHKYTEDATLSAINDTGADEELMETNFKAKDAEAESRGKNNNRAELIEKEQSTPELNNREGEGYSSELTSDCDSDAVDADVGFYENDDDDSQSSSDLTPDDEFKPRFCNSDLGPDVFSEEPGNLVDDSESETVKKERVTSIVTAEHAKKLSSNIDAQKGPTLSDEKLRKYDGFYEMGKQNSDRFFADQNLKGRHTVEKVVAKIFIKQPTVSNQIGEGDGGDSTKNLSADTPMGDESERESISIDLESKDYSPESQVSKHREGDAVRARLSEIKTRAKMQVESSGQHDIDLNRSTFVTITERPENDSLTNEYPIEETQKQAATVIQAAFRSWTAVEVYQLKKFAACLIQSHARGRSVRRQLNKTTIHLLPSAQIQENSEDGLGKADGAYAKIHEDESTILRKEYASTQSTCPENDAERESFSGRYGQSKYNNHSENEDNTARNGAHALTTNISLSAEAESGQTTSYQSTSVIIEAVSGAEHEAMSTTEIKETKEKYSVEDAEAKLLEMECIAAVKAANDALKQSKSKSSWGFKLFSSSKTEGDHAEDKTAFNFLRVSNSNNGQATDQPVNRAHSDYVSSDDGGFTSDDNFLSCDEFENGDESEAEIEGGNTTCNSRQPKELAVADKTRTPTECQTSKEIKSRPWGLLKTMFSATAKTNEANTESEANSNVVVDAVVDPVARTVQTAKTLENRSSKTIVARQVAPANTDSTDGSVVDDSEVGSILEEESRLKALNFLLENEGDDTSMEEAGEAF